MNPLEISEMAKTAAAQSDRWVMMALLIVLGVCMVLAVKYLVGQQRELIADHKAARECYEGTLREIVENGHKVQLELAVKIHENTGAMRENTEELRRRR